MYSKFYSSMRRFWWGGEIEQYVRSLMRTQWLSKQELESMQLKRIQRVIKHAYENVPYYRSRYRKDGVHPQDIKSLQNIHSLPLLLVKSLKSENQA